MMAKLITLHGFLGSPNNWDFLQRELHQYKKHHLDLFDQSVFDPEKGLWHAGKAMNNIAKNLPNEKVLIGYSLGGRIALHALIDDPSLWKAAVIISANPGLSSTNEKERRYRHDTNWSERFGLDPWEKVMTDWDEQSVFAGNKIRRNETDFSREALAKGLTGWSLGKQDDLASSIEELHLPILWITGGNDNKFTSIAKGVQLSHPLSKHCVINDAFHRVPWEQQGLFVKEMSNFLEVLKKEKK